MTLRVTVAEIRREIAKQLGVSMSGSGPNGSLTLDNPFAINGALTSTAAIFNWAKGASAFSATLQAFERQGVAHTLAEPTVTAVSGESAKFMAGGTIPIAQSEILQGRQQQRHACTIGFIQQPYGVTLNFTPVVLSAGAHPVADCDRGHRHRLRDADDDPRRQQRQHHHPRVPHPQQCHHGRVALRRLDRQRRPDQDRRPSRRSTACRR